MITAEIGDALLRGILDNPDDAALRLIYADWLEEEGLEPVRRAMMRGERFTKIEGGLVRAVFPELAHFVARYGLEVWADGGRWRLADRVGPPTHPDTEKIVFRRGFVESVRCPLAAWREHGPAIVRAHPVARVEFSGKEPNGYPASEAEKNYFRWFSGETADGPDGDDPEELPSWLWPIYAEMHAGGWEHPTRELALSALSGAALAWANLPEDER